MTSDRGRRGGETLLKAAGVISLLGYFFWFAGRGLGIGFSPEDLMNLYFSWRQPLGEQLLDLAAFFRVSPSFRPAGALFYRGLFEAFGFQELFFRIACFALLAANLWLAYALIRRLTDSKAAAAVAVLLHAYHGNAWFLYFTTAYCYDLLCFFWYTAAWLYYLRVRRSGLPVGWGQMLVWSGLYVLALGSKEMAISLPAVLLAYELLVSPPVGRRPASLAGWILREGRVPLIGSVLTAFFIVGRVSDPHGLTGIGAYRPVFRLSILLDRTYHFLAYALYEPRWLTPAVAGVLALAGVAAVVRFRSLPFRLGAAWALIGILPVAFISQRNLGTAYIPGLGACLSIAVALCAVARRAAALLPGTINRRQMAGRLHGPLVFTATLLVLILVHGQYGQLDPEHMIPEARDVRLAYEQLSRRPEAIPPGAEVLFLNDPFPCNEWTSLFLVVLYSRDPTVKVFRMDRLMRDSSPEALLHPDVVLTWRDDQLLECNAADFRGLMVRELPERHRQSVCQARAGSGRPAGAPHPHAMARQ